MRDFDSAIEGLDLDLREKLKDSSLSTSEANLIQLRRELARLTSLFVLMELRLKEIQKNTDLC